MIEVLTQNGWYKWTSCTCGGSYKEKYKHPSKPDKQIHIRPNQNKWFYLQNKRIWGQGTGAAALAAKLTEI